MATGTGKDQCITCGKEKRVVRCEGCRQLYCFVHLPVHHQELSLELDEIEMNRDIFRQTLNEQTNDKKKHSLIKQIDKWEEDSIKNIQETAKECRQLLIQHTTEHVNRIEINFAELTDQIKEIRKENDFNEIDLKQFKQQLTQLANELERPPKISIQQFPGSLIPRISVVVSSPFPRIDFNTTWKQNGITIAGGNGKGNQLNQLDNPYGIYVDDDNKCIYIADYANHRIVEWKCSAKNGKVVAGGNGQGNRMDQLNGPTDVIIDQKNDSMIICDKDNKRLIRSSRRNDINQQIIISDIDCSRLTMDNNGDLYVSDREKNEVRRWKIGDKNGTIVAGGNGKGNNLKQLNSPRFIFVDEDHSVYVSDFDNHRVMKWMKGAKEGIVVAGGQGQGNSLEQLDHPQGLIVDHLGNVYVAEWDNHRITRWSPGSAEGSIVVGGNGKGDQPNQFNYPAGLSFDGEGNLYVVDCGNARVQKFDKN